MEGAEIALLGRFAFTITFLVMLLLISGMIADHNSATIALLCGVSFFFFFGCLVLLALSGQLARIHGDYQKEKTTRHYQQLYFSVNSLELPSLPAPRDERVFMPPDSHFIPAVPAVDDGLKLAAYDFVYALFSDGAPDPKRILSEESKSPGQIQFKKPRPEVVEYLLALDIVRVGANKMLFFNTAQFPTLVEAGRMIKFGKREQP